MTVDLMSAEAERAAVDVVKQAIELYNGDAQLTPSQALIKASESHDFTPDMLCRLTEAFNSSAQVAHLETSDVNKRAESIPLANPAEVVEAFFPDNVQSRAEKAAAVEAPDCYDTPEHGDFMPVMEEMEKAAREAPIKLARTPRRYEADPDMLYGRIAKNKQAAYRKSEVLQTEAQEHLDKVAALADRLIQYFRQPGHLPFAEVEKRARLNFTGVEKLLDHVFDQGNLAKSGEVRAEMTGKELAFIKDASVEPYSLIKVAVEAGEGYARALVKAAGILDEADTQYARDMSDYQQYKAAVNVKSALISAMTGGAASAEKLLQPPEPEKPVPMPVISDPEHEAQLASIEQQAALNDLLANDPVISAVDPQEVIRAFNQLSAMAPHVARDPNVLRSVLRRYVQQQDVDPFEIKQLVDLDVAMKKRDEPVGAERFVLS